MLIFDNDDYFVLESSSGDTMFYFSDGDFPFHAVDGHVLSEQEARDWLAAFDVGYKMGIDRGEHASQSERIDEIDIDHLRLERAQRNERMNQ